MSIIVQDDFQAPDGTPLAYRRLGNSRWYSQPAGNLANVLIESGEAVPQLDASGNLLCLVPTGSIDGFIEAVIRFPSTGNWHGGICARGDGNAVNGVCLAGGNIYTGSPCFHPIDLGTGYADNIAAPGLPGKTVVLGMILKGPKTQFFVNNQKIAEEDFPCTVFYDWAGVYVFTDPGTADHCPVYLNWKFETLP